MSHGPKKRNLHPCCSPLPLLSHRPDPFRRAGTFPEDRKARQRWCHGVGCSGGERGLGSLSLGPFPSSSQEPPAQDASSPGLPLPGRDSLYLYEAPAGLLLQGNLGGEGLGGRPSRRNHNRGRFRRHHAGGGPGGLSGPKGGKQALRSRLGCGEQGLSPPQGGVLASPQPTLEGGGRRPSVDQERAPLPRL